MVIESPKNSGQNAFLVRQGCLEKQLQFDTEIAYYARTQGAAIVSLLRHRISEIIIGRYNISNIYWTSYKLPEMKVLMLMKEEADIEK